jgi:CelD/BcsL family acetyltransferase involved in cellulose biosynthesis
MPSTIYQTEIARTREAVESLRDVWKGLHSRLDADIDFFLEFMKVHADFALRPHVIALRKDARIVTILPGRLERQSMRMRVGYRWIELPKVNQLIFIGQLLGEDGNEAIAEIMKGIQTSLRQKEADAALFHHVDSQEPLHGMLENAGSILTRDYFQDSEENWKTRISGDYQAFLKSRSGNTRHNIRRYSKRLLDAFPGKVEHRIFREAKDLPAVFRDCETIAAKSYHRGLGVGFFDDAATRQLFTLAATQGWLRSYVLYLDGRPSAFWNGLLYRDTFEARVTAYDAQLSGLRPGLYLLQRLVEDLCANGSVRELDFGTGSAQYKRDMCDISRIRVSKLLFAPSFKGIAVNGLRTPLLALTHGARWILTRLGFFAKIRKEWRSRLSAKDPVQHPDKTIPAVERQHDA